MTASPSTAPRWRRVVAIAIAVAGLAGAAAIVATEPPPPPPPTRAAVKLRVAGRELAPGDDAVGRALDHVRRFAIGEVKLTLPGDKTIAIARADFGLELDRLRLAEFVKDAADPESALARAHAAGPDPTAPIDAPLPLRIDAARALSKLVDLKAELDQPAIDATIDLEARKVKPEEKGYRLDVYATLARIEDAFRAGKTEVAAAVEEVLPKRTAKELGDVRFEHVLGWFETRYNVARKYEDRTYNLRLAASRLDGRVVMPGEIVDFNAVVGPRDEAHGFRVAKVIAQGELVDGIGGGTCQISGTLHAAAFFAGLEIVERYPHSRPSSYIKLGLDATVAYPNINYRFKNPFDFPIVLHEKVAGGVVRAEILGPERKLTVSYFRRIDDVVPFEEAERETDKLPKGERVVVQRGIPGFAATASRVVRDGAYADRWKWTEKYPPTTQIVAVGTGPDDTKPAVVEDNHPEYTVDEVLVITQGPMVRGEGPPGGAMSEARTAGKTGETGWIQRLGLEKTPVGPGSADDAGGSDAAAKNGSTSEPKPGDERDPPKKSDAKKNDGTKTDPKKPARSDAKKGDAKKPAKDEPKRSDTKKPAKSDTKKGDAKKSAKG
jgi:vancomycin resistance protein YoaR